MLSGHFENCYGIKEFDMGTGIDFSRSNKAIIYAPNGVMKTSFTKVFEDLSKGEAAKDRIFPSAVTSYSIRYYTTDYVFTSANPRQIPSCNAVYVVNSFADNFEFTKETVSTLLADEATRNAYNVLIAQFMEQIKVFEAELAAKSGLTKPKVKPTLISDFQLPITADWPDIINTLHDQLQTEEPIIYLNEIKYTELLSDKAIAAYGKTEFRRYIQQYIERLGELLQDSELLSNNFTDRSAEALTKSFTTNDLFSVNHKVVLRDGTEICSLDEWKQVVDSQIQRMYADDTLRAAFEKLKKLLTANNEVDKARQIIIENQQIIPLLFELMHTKKRMWASYCSQMERSFNEYYDVITAFTTRVRELYERAEAQSERWKQVVEEFNRRFRVPFTVQINNKSNFILKDEAPNLSFIYKRGSGENTESTDLTKEDLLPSLSMGEKRAMYLLYILFDLERIRIQAAAGQKHLVITDDIADSFDYKNKYAIIEYLADLSKNTGIDLLMLTHNFDFYRTVKSRLGVVRNNCFIAQKDESGKIKMDVFRYQKDFFKNVIIAGINGTDAYKQKKMLDEKARLFYLEEAVKSAWSTRQLDRQINTMFYQRLLSSRDKESVAAEIEKSAPKPEYTRIVHDPYVLEFLELEDNEHYYEGDLEQAIIDHLQKFFLEMGRGFTFVGRQVHVVIGKKHFHIDLVLYNILLRCYVLIDLKIDELTHEDIGQMQMYVNYYTRERMNPGDIPPIGILLCAEKDDAVVQYTLPEDNQQIFATKYMPYLPSKEELKRELNLDDFEKK